MLLWEIITCQSKFKPFIASGRHPNAIHLSNYIQNYNNYSYNCCSCSLFPSVSWSVSESLPRSPAIGRDSSCRYIVWAPGTSAQPLSSGQKLQTSNVNTWLDTSNISVWEELIQVHIELLRSPTSNSLQSRPALVLYFKKSFKWQIKQRWDT